MANNQTGQWRVNGSDQSTAIWVEDATGKRVCSVRNCETDLDRARLIAAAPELLAALEELLEHVQWRRRIAKEKTGPHDVTHRAIAALSKAKGE